jgi:uncharacterized membrane protein YfcA
METDMVVVAAGAFFAALAIGSAGFAFSMVATAFWIYVLPPPVVVLLAATAGTLLHGISMWRYRHVIDYRRLLPFVIGGVIGVPLGVWTGGSVDIVTFRRIVGALMIFYGIYTLVGFPLRPVGEGGGHVMRASDTLVGWLGGVLGGVCMLNGPLITIWCTLRGWDKVASRHVYQPYIWCTSFAVMATSGLTIGVNASRIPLYLAVLLPGAMAGLALGHRLFDWVNEQQFRRLLSFLIFASGVSLVF